MEDMNYTELDWRWAIVYGVALRDGFLGAVADKPRSADGVARELGLDERAVCVLLSALGELGILEEKEGKFRLREEHRGPLLEPEHFDYVGGSVVHRCELIGSWSRIGEILRTGGRPRPAPPRLRRHGDPRPVDAPRGAQVRKESSGPYVRGCSKAPASSRWGRTRYERRGVGLTWPRLACPSGWRRQPSQPAPHPPLVA
jgi:hypothetical protein